MRKCRQSSNGLGALERGALLTPLCHERCGDRGRRDDVADATTMSTNPCQACQCTFNCQCAQQLLCMRFGCMSWRAVIVTEPSATRGWQPS